MVPWSERPPRSFGTAVISLDSASRSLCSNTRRGSAAPCADPGHRRLAAGCVERAAQHPPVNHHHALAGLGKPADDALEAAAKRFGIAVAEPAAEPIMARTALLEPAEAARERLVRSGERRPIGRAVAAPRTAQPLVDVVPTGVAVARVLQPFPARGKLIPSILLCVFTTPTGRVDHARIGQVPSRMSSHFEVPFPWIALRVIALQNRASKLAR